MLVIPDMAAISFDLNLREELNVMISKRIMSCDCVQVEPTQNVMNDHLTAYRHVVKRETRPYFNA